MSIRSYLYPTSLIIVVSLGSIYGANLKAQGTDIKHLSDLDPAAAMAELTLLREQLVAQRIIQQRKLDRWRAAQDVQ